MKKLILYLLAITMALACDNGQIAEEGHEDESGGHDHAEGVIELSGEQMKNIGLKFGQMQKKAIHSLVKLNGRVELPASGRAVATSPIGGRIVEVLVEPGQTVKKGQRLFSVFSLELVDWQQQYLQDKADLSFLENEMARQKQLSEEKLAAAKQYQEVQAKYRSKQFSIQAFEQKFSALGINLTEASEKLRDQFYVFASSSGRIEHVNIHSGAFVEPSSNLVEIINDEDLHLHLLAYGKQSEFLGVGQTLKFNVQSRPAKIQSAKIKWINNVLNEENNSYDIHAEVEQSAKGLLAGEFVEARIVSEVDSLWSVPTNALTFDRGLQYLFVLAGADSHGTHFRKVQIQTGVEDLGYVEVLPVDKLEISDQIVMDGAFFLMAETKKQEMGESGHSHAH